MYKKDDEIILTKTGQKDIITQVEVTSGGCYYYLKDNGRVVESDITDCLKLYQDEVYVAYNKEFKEYLAKPGFGYTTDELSEVNMFESKEEIKEYLKDYVAFYKDFEVKKMKRRLEVIDI